MGKLLVRLAINAVALAVAAWLVPGVGFGASGEGSIVPVLVVALIFGIVNALIKPLIQLATCPFYVLTLGLFTLIVNALMLWLTAAIAGALEQPFFVSGFGPALFASIIISIVSALLSMFLDDEKRERREK